MLEEPLHDSRTAVDYGWRLILRIVAYSETAEPRRDVFVYDIPVVSHRLQIAFKIAVQSKRNFVGAYYILECNFFTWWGIRYFLGRVEFTVWYVVF